MIRVCSSLRPKTEDMGDAIRFEADYVERQDGRGSLFAHACPRCSARLRREGGRSPKRWRIVKTGPVVPFVGDRLPRCGVCKRPLRRVSGRQEGLFSPAEIRRWRKECNRRGAGDRRRSRRRRKGRFMAAGSETRASE